MLQQNLLATLEHQADISNLHSLPHCSLIMRLNIALCWLKLLLKTPENLHVVLSSVIYSWWGSQRDFPAPSDHSPGAPCLTASLQGMCISCSLLFPGTDLLTTISLSLHPWHQGDLCKAQREDRKYFRNSAGSVWRDQFFAQVPRLDGAVELGDTRPSILKRK